MKKKGKKSEGVERFCIRPREVGHVWVLVLGGCLALSCKGCLRRMSLLVDHDIHELSIDVEFLLPEHVWGNRSRLEMCVPCVISDRKERVVLAISALMTNQ